MSDGPSPATLQVVTALEKAASKGNSEAQFRLGLMYANGDELPLDYTRAAQLISEAANAGMTDAQSTMGWLYANGYGVHQNDEIAYRWYLKAAEQGSAKDQYLLGTMSRFGQYGQSRDPQAALAWYTKAADQGFAPAQFAIGKMLMDGKHVTEDRVAAFQWLSLAHVNGSKRAEDTVKELLKAMTPEEVLRAKAQMLAAAGGQLSAGGAASD